MRQILDEQTRTAREGEGLIKVDYTIPNQAHLSSPMRMFVAFNCDALHYSRPEKSPIMRNGGGLFLPFP